MTFIARGRNDLWGGLLLAIGLALGATALIGISLFQVAATVFFVWLALARDKGWAWIPAAIFGFQVAHDLFDGVGGSLFFPVLVIAAGVVLLSRDRLSRKATVGILVLLAVIGIAADNQPRQKRVEVDAAVQPAAAPEFAELPPLNGRSLVVDAGARDVDLVTSRSSEPRVGTDSGFEVSEGPGIVMVTVEQSSTPLEMQVPAEASVVVRTTTGDVTAVIDRFSIDVHTITGRIDAELEGTHIVSAETRDGKIDNRGLEDLDDSPETLVTAGAGLPVRLKTISGAIAVGRD